MSPGLTGARTTAIVAALGNAPVLTISDLDDFTQLGGIVQLFVENGRMRFDLNLAAAKRGRLLLSSKLLVLAAHVRDDPTGRTVNRASGTGECQGRGDTKTSHDQNADLRPGAGDRPGSGCRQDGWTRSSRCPI